MKTTNLATVSAATADGEASAVPFQKKLEKVRVNLDVSAASGTSPTLDVDITATVNGTDQVIASFAQKTAVGQETLVIDACPDSVKVEYAIGGTTPSFTFNVDVQHN